MGIPIGSKIPLKIMTPNSNNKIGVKTFPILSITPVGLITKANAIPKYIMENIIGLAPGKVGNIAISKAVAPVLGIANKGPIANTTVIPKNLLNNGDTLLPSLSTSPPAFVEAIMPSNGNPIPVTKNPSIDQFHFCPANNPKNGGNIRFPAPKNMENNAAPNISASLFFFFTNNTSFLIFLN